jgi:hypothetical protein
MKTASQIGTCGRLVQACISLDDPIGDPAGGVLADRGAVDLGEVCGDVPGGQWLGIQRDRYRVDVSQQTLSLLDDDRVEGARADHEDFDGDLTCGVGQHRLRAGAVADVVRTTGRRPVFGVSEVVGHLLLERALEDGRGDSTSTACPGR